MSGVLSSMQVRGDAPILSRKGPGSASPPPTWTEAVAANWRLNQDDSEDYSFSNELDAYQDIEDALVATGRPRARYRDPNWRTFLTTVETAPERRARIWSDLVEARKVNPRAFADVPAKTQKEFEIWAARRKGERDRDQAIAARGGTGTAILPGLAYGLTRMGDPENIAQIPLGGAGRTVAGTLLRQFGAGVLGTAITAPQLALVRSRMGEGYSSEDLATDLVLGGVTNAAFVGGQMAIGRYGPKAVDALGNVAAAGRQAAENVVPLDLKLARALDQAVPAELRPPEVHDAINVINHAVEVDATSPYVLSHAGLERHVEKLGTALDALESLPVPSSQPVLAARARTPVQQASAGNFDSESALQFILRLEGGAQLVTDSGGLTKYGISAKGNPGVDIANLTEAQALAIYRRKYLGGLNLTGRSGEAALVALDASVNHGPQFAKSILAAAGDDPARMIALRRAEYARLIREDPAKYARYEKGWENRLQQVEQRIGLRAGEAGMADALDVPAPAPVVRPDALDTVRPLVTSEGRQLPMATFKPDEIGVDAGLMQFKGGGDEFGVTERLQGVSEWDPLAAGMVTVWEANDGRRLIADGHQRLGLARRMQAAGGQQDIQLNAFVLREADGFTARAARVLTALKNIGEGTGSATDAAKVFREAGVAVEGALERRLPPRSALVRDGKALARLSDDAFGAVVNEVIPESHAAAIGRLAPDPGTHMALVDLLHKTQPANARQAEAILRQALEAGFSRETQIDMFGSADAVTALFAQKAKALDRALAELRKMKGAFQVAARNADTLESAGNTISVDASTAAAEGNARALALVERLALRKGNAVNELFNEAARRLANGERVDVVTRDLVRAIGELDLDQLARGADDGGTLRAADGTGDDAVGSGRGAIADDEAGAARGADSPATLDELEAAGQGGFALFDDAAHQSFDDPAGPGVQQVADSIWHDLRAEADPNIAALERQRTQLGAEAPLRAGAEQDGTMGSPLFDAADQPGFDLGDGKGARSIGEIEAELDAEASGIEAIRGCLL